MTLSGTTPQRSGRRPEAAADRAGGVPQWPWCAFDGSLKLLGLDYVDLYLIHWPVPGQNAYVETWRALEKILAGGKARAIGVSNFQIPHLERLMKETGVVRPSTRSSCTPACSSRHCAGSTSSTAS